MASAIWVVRRSCTCGRRAKGRPAAKPSASSAVRISGSDARALVADGARVESAFEEAAEHVLKPERILRRALSDLAGCYDFAILD